MSLDSFKKQGSVPQDANGAEMILVAEIIAPHGVKGAVSAESYSDNPRRFDVGAQLASNQGRMLTISASSLHKGRLLLTFDGVEDRDSAEKLRGWRLYAADSPPLPEGSYYYFELIGLEVREQGQRIGEIQDILPYSANDVYVVKTDAGGEIMVPALRTIVKQVCVQEGFMEVDLPEGLR